jgi:hypothetical protein
MAIRLDGSRYSRNAHFLTLTGAFGYAESPEYNLGFKPICCLSQRQDRPVISWLLQLSRAPACGIVNELRQRPRTIKSCKSTWNFARSSCFLG